MLENRSISFHLDFFQEVEHPSEEADTRARQSPMETVALIMLLEAMTVNNPRENSGMTEGAIA